MGRGGGLRGGAAGSLGPTPPLTTPSPPGPHLPTPSPPPLFSPALPSLPCSSPLPPPLPSSSPPCPPPLPLPSPLPSLPSPSSPDVSAGGRLAGALGPPHSALALRGEACGCPGSSAPSCWPPAAAAAPRVSRGAGARTPMAGAPPGVRPPSRAPAPLSARLQPRSESGSEWGAGKGGAEPLEARGRGLWGRGGTSLGCSAPGRDRSDGRRAARAPSGHRGSCGSAATGKGSFSAGGARPLPSRRAGRGQGLGWGVTAPPPGERKTGGRDEGSQSGSAQTCSTSETGAALGGTAPGTVSPGPCPCRSRRPAGEGWAGQCQLAGLVPGADRLPSGLHFWAKGSIRLCSLRRSRRPVLLS